MNQLFGINHQVQGPRWYNLSQAWINMKGWIAAALRSSQGPLKNDMNNHCCWMHSLLSQQSIVTYCKRRDITVQSAALPRLSDVLQVGYQNEEWLISHIYISIAGRLCYLDMNNMTWWPVLTHHWFLPLFEPVDGVGQVSSFCEDLLASFHGSWIDITAFILPHSITQRQGKRGC